MSDILKQIAQQQRAENEARKAQQAQADEARGKKKQFQLARDSVISFCHFEIPAGQEKSFFKDAEKAFIELGKYLVDAGWAEYLPLISELRKAKGDRVECAFCECLRLAIDLKTKRGSLAKSIEEISTWANGMHFSDAADNVLLYLRDRYMNGGKSLPEKSLEVINSSTEEMNRVAIWENYVAEAEEKHIVNKWQYARDKWNKTHSAEKLSTKRKMVAVI